MKARLSLGRVRLDSDQVPCLPPAGFAPKRHKPLVALACSQKMLKLKLQGQNQQVTIFFTQSPLQPAQ